MIFSQFFISYDFIIDNVSQSIKISQNGVSLIF